MHVIKSERAKISIDRYIYLLVFFWPYSNLIKSELQKKKLK